MEISACNRAVALSENYKMKSSHKPNKQFVGTSFYKQNCVATADAVLLNKDAVLLTINRKYGIIMSI